MNAQELYRQQLSVWPEFRERVEQLHQIELKKIDMGNFTVWAQHNPARAVSSGAALDAKSIAARKCFLCEENRPAIQEKVELDDSFDLLVNPFPILLEHFTIAAKQHRPQEILPVYRNMIRFATMMPEHTILYNGPECGASAPDHMHFQAVKRGQLPLENEWKKQDVEMAFQSCDGSVYNLLNYGRTCFHIEAQSEERIKHLFEELYRTLPAEEGKEPKMNIFTYYEEACWHTFVFSRKRHRPSHFFAAGDDFKMISPGAIDIAGILVLPRKEDFDAFDRSTVEDIFQQVSL